MKLGINGFGRIGRMVLRGSSRLKTSGIVAASFVIAVGLLFACGTVAMAEQKPKNVIVMIVDGGGFNHSLAANYYEFGKADGRIYNNFPVRLAVSTYPARSEYTNAMPPPPGSRECVSKKPIGNACFDSYKAGRGYDPSLAWKNYSYVKYCFTDSAAAATALATGLKTESGSIGVDINDKILENVVEIAEQNGKSTGIVTTKAVVDATPAAFCVHDVSRTDSLGISSHLCRLRAPLPEVMGKKNTQTVWCPFGPRAGLILNG